MLFSQLLISFDIMLSNDLVHFACFTNIFAETLTLKRVPYKRKNFPGIPAGK
jgi:hypothetical protein